jgi:hypothetical protein
MPAQPFTGHATVQEVKHHTGWSQGVWWTKWHWDRFFFILVLLLYTNSNVILGRYNRTTGPRIIQSVQRLEHRLDKPRFQSQPITSHSLDNKTGYLAVQHPKQKANTNCVALLLLIPMSDGSILCPETYYPDVSWFSSNLPAKCHASTSIKPHLVTFQQSSQWATNSIIK